MSEHRKLPTLSEVASTPANCLSCAYRGPCGGLDEQQQMWGCLVRCGNGCGAERGACDYTCPRRPVQFAKRWSEVGGMFTQREPQLLPLADTSLPAYMPVLQHRYRRVVTLDVPWVALPAFDVLRVGADGRLAPRFATAEALRAGYHVAPGSRVLLVSVAVDAALERYWHHRTLDAVPTALAQLDLAAVTVPNYSYFADAPRTHTLWNRARMGRVAQELTDAGIVAVPHFNAETEGDWEAWTKLLRRQPNVTHIVKEFQTGNANARAGLAALDRLRRLQDSLGRDLHPILVGAARFAAEVKAAFARFTIVDSRPFMETMARRRAALGSSPSIRWTRQSTPRGAPLDGLLEHNVRTYARWVDRLAARPFDRNVEGKQLSLRLWPETRIIAA